MPNIKHLDAPFWVMLLVGLFSLGSLGFFGIAAASQRPTVEADILDTDDFQPPTDL